MSFWLQASTVDGFSEEALVAVIPTADHVKTLLKVPKWLSIWSS